MQNRYDAGRQLVGTVQIDPDGSGPLHNRAVRYTRDGAGRVTLVEQGTVTSESDSAWSSFSVLAQQATTYDAIGRAVKTSLVTGGTTRQVNAYW